MKFLLSGTLTGHEQDVRGVAAHGSSVFSASRDGTVRSWNTNDNHGRWTSEAIDSAIVFASPTGSFVNSVAVVTVDGEPLVASGGKDALIYLSEPYASDRKPGDDVGKYQLIGHEANVCALHFSEDTLISGSWDATAKVWDLNSFAVKYNLLGHQSSVWDVKAIDSETFLTCSADRTIKQWHRDKVVATYEGHTDVVRKLLLLPGGATFASCSNDGTIKLWDLATARVLDTLVGHESFVYDVGVLDNGDLVSSGEDRTVRVWRDGAVVQVLTLPSISLWCVSVLANGDFVVGGSDNTLRVFTRSSERAATPQDQKQLRESVEQSSIAEQSVDNLKKSDVPGYDALNSPGKHEGATLMVKSPQGVIEAHQWSGGEWVKIGDVVGSTGSQKKQTFDGKDYDYVFDVDIEDGAPPLKLPFNVNDNPYVAAQRFLADNELPASYTDEVVRFIMQNTSGVSLDSAPVENPYADSAGSAASTPGPSAKSLRVLPIETYIQFKDYKPEQLLKGLHKFNQETFTSEEMADVAKRLHTLTSKDALYIITQIVPRVPPQGQLIAYDLLRVSIPRVTAVDLLNSTEAAEVVMKAVAAIKTVAASKIPEYMMLLKVLSNLIGNTLFIQLYIEPNDEGQYEFNVLFEELLQDLSRLLQELSGETAKHHATMMTTAATFVYDLSVYSRKTALLARGAVKPIVKFGDEVGQALAGSNSEAAYRVTAAFGNFATKGTAVPGWVRQRRYDETRFDELHGDLDALARDH